MAEGFEDLATAARMRDVVRRIAIDVLDEERPPYQYGVVESINPDLRSCRVIMRGDTTAIPVKILGIQPAESGQTVQVSGRRGDKFISGVVGRSASVDVPEADLGTPTLTLLPWVGAVRASWTVVANAHHYEVQFADDVGFTVTVRTFDTISTILTLDGLNEGETVFSRVRARNGTGGAGPWSNVESATAEAVGGGGDPSDGSPPSDSPDAVVTPGIGYLLAEWLPISNADMVTYEVHIDTTSGFTPDATTKIGETTGTFYFVKRDADGVELAYDTIYFIRLIAKDADGAAAAGAQGSGTIDRVELGDVGNVPDSEISDGVIPATSPDITNVHNGVGFLYVQWDHISNPDAVTYEVHVSDTDGFTPSSNTLVGDTPANRFFIRNQGPGATPAEGALEYGVPYYIKIWAKDKDGYAPAPGAQASGVTVKVDTADLAVGAITAGSAIIADLAVDTAHLAEASITTAKIADLAVNNAKIANLSVDQAKIADAAILTAKIGNLQVTTAKIADLAVDTAKIADAAINSAKILNASVVNAKIADAAITTAKIANAAITNAKIGDAQITNAKIANASIDSAKIINGTIQTADIANAAITNAKIDSLAASKITAGTISTTTINVDAVLNLSGTGTIKTSSSGTRMEFRAGWGNNMRWYEGGTQAGIVGASSLYMFMSSSNGKWLRLNSATYLQIIADYVSSPEVRAPRFVMNAGRTGDIHAVGSGGIGMRSRSGEATGVMCYADDSASVMKAVAGNNGSWRNHHALDHIAHTSDPRLKSDVQDLSPADKAALRQVFVTARPKKFTYTDPDAGQHLQGRRTVGFMATELPEDARAVETLNDHSDERETVYTTGFSPGRVSAYLWAAVADIYERLEAAGA